MRTIIRVPNWLGDAVMALPAIESVSARDSVVIAARPSVADLFPAGSVKVLPRGGDVAVLKSIDADRIILLTHSFSSAFHAWRSGIPERIGEARHFRSRFLTRVAPSPRKPVHQIDEYLQLVFSAGYKPVPREPVLPPRAPSPFAYPYIALCPGAMYGSAKCWPGFAELASALAEAGKRVVVLGTKGESGFRGAPRAGVENLIGRTSLKEALDIIAHASVVVSNDSGMAHAARALGRRTVVIFGPTEPERTAPDGADVIVGEAECAPCLLRTCPIDHRCMRNVTIGDVLERIATHV